MEKDKVWYAVYGSNLNQQRFNCYIKGGIPDGALEDNKGCYDKTPAIDGGKVLLPYQLYFAKESKKWEKKAVAFIDLERGPRVKTLGRKYLVTQEQFKDIFKQENSIDIDKPIDINLEKIKAIGSEVIRESWYGNIIFLGEIDKMSIFTLTAYWNMDSEDALPPLPTYLKNIIEGIKQTYAFSNEQIFEYLAQKPGVRNNFSRQDLLNLIQQ